MLVSEIKTRLEKAEDEVTSCAWHTHVLGEYSVPPEQSWPPQNMWDKVALWAPEIHRARNRAQTPGKCWQLLVLIRVPVIEE